MATSQIPSETSIGYNKLATLFDDYDDLAMFRCFNDLSFKDLLHRQAELLRLRQKLENQVEYDFHAEKIDAEDVANCWRTLEDSSEGYVGYRQKQIMLEIREKLRGYRKFIGSVVVSRAQRKVGEALLQTAEIKALGRPQTWAYDYLKEWFARPLGGNNFLRGVEADAWRPEYVPNLVVLSRPSKDRDHFAQFLSDTFLPSFHRRIGQKFKSPIPESKVYGTWEYKQKTFVVLGDVICIILSALVPSISIFVLSFLNNMVARLTVITAMSFAFSIIMTLIVQGRRVDVFAATTAFAAVQVVFLGGQNFIPVA